MYGMKWSFCKPERNLASVLGEIGNYWIFKQSRARYNSDVEKNTLTLMGNG